MIKIKISKVNMHVTYDVSGSIKNIKNFDIKISDHLEVYNIPYASSVVDIGIMNEFMSRDYMLIQGMTAYSKNFIGTLCNIKLMIGQ